MFLAMLGFQTMGGFYRLCLNYLLQQRDDSLATTYVKSNMGNSKILVKSVSLRKIFLFCDFSFYHKCSFWHNCIVIQKNKKWTPPVVAYDSFLGDAINYDRPKYYFVIIFCQVPTHLPVDSRTVPRRTFLRRTLLRQDTSLTGHIPTDI